jgi:hypothetical protein
MYLHLGNDMMIRTDKIVGIFDIENTSTSKISREYLNSPNKKVITVSYEMPKAFVVCINDDNEEEIYITQISASTLKKRNEAAFDI